MQLSDSPMEFVVAAILFIAAVLLVLLGVLLVLDGGGLRVLKGFV